MIGFIILGIIAALIGVVLVVNAIRGGIHTPRATAMLIGGMMLAAFGIVLAGFAMAYQNAEPLDLNAVTAK